QPASELSLERVKVVRDVETASGAGPLLVVDGDARPVGWADPQRPGQVFALGATFSPETDSLRAALDSALTSPYGLAVAVTADTHRYAGVVSADAILDKVRDERASIAESISIRDLEAAEEDASLDQSEPSYEEVTGPADDDDPDDWENEVTQAIEPKNEPMPAPQPAQDQSEPISDTSADEPVADHVQADAQPQPETDVAENGDTSIGIEHPESTTGRVGDRTPVMQ